MTMRQKFDSIVMCDSFMHKLNFITDKKLEQTLRHLVCVCPYKFSEEDSFSQGGEW